MTNSELSHEDVTRILRLIDELPDGETRLEVGDIKLHVRKGTGEARLEPVAVAPLPDQSSMDSPATQPRPAVQSVSGAATANGDGEVESGLVVVRAPMLGRFYRASSPDSPPFVEVGSRVEPDDTICLIEVMKLFNTVKADVRGIIVEIRSESNMMVEYGQILFTIRPI